MSELATQNEYVLRLRELEAAEKLREQGERLAAEVSRERARCGVWFWAYARNAEP